VGSATAMMGGEVGCPRAAAPLLLPSALMAACHYTQDTKVSGFVAAVSDDVDVGAMCNYAISPHGSLPLHTRHKSKWFCGCGGCGAVTTQDTKVNGFVAAV